jgi:hypothetical protein|nr:MAG TPA: hypothetical protein [Caudoviricetes sp.]
MSSDGNKELTAGKDRHATGKGIDYTRYIFGCNGKTMQCPYRCGVTQFLLAG